MKYSFLTFLIVCGCWAQAQIVNIPDANFKNALLNKMSQIPLGMDMLIAR